MQILLNLPGNNLFRRAQAVLVTTAKMLNLVNKTTEENALDGRQLLQHKGVTLRV